uniref:Uncharacterized protein n=1 Tax=Hyaloperonospora arabidopsidis (strain Emoy2) TaxID=559515 RepID=M4BGC6_HYAAE
MRTRLCIFSRDHYLKPFYLIEALLVLIATIQCFCINLSVMLRFSSKESNLDSHSSRGNDNTHKTFDLVQVLTPEYMSSYKEMNTLGILMSNMDFNKFLSDCIHQHFACSSLTVISGATTPSAFFRCATKLLCVCL